MLQGTYQLALKPFLKRLRQTPVINAPLTGVLRWGLGRFGLELPHRFQSLYRAGEFKLELPLGGTVRVSAGGDDSVTSALFWWGWRSHEPETLALFQALAREAVTVVDVGAHVGLFALVAAASVRSGGVVYAFEPMPRCFDRLQLNVALNGFNNTRLSSAAAGAAATTSKFYFVEGVATPMFGGLAEMFASDASMAATSVEVLTLDAAIGAQRVDLVKLDTETTEADVLRGAATILARDRPTIITEVWDEPRGDALTAILKPLGYRFFALERSGPRATEVVRGGRASMNCLATVRSEEQILALSRDAFEKAGLAT
jgi:FkbM family methyltransferase